MKKSRWISFCGWACFGLLLFGVTAVFLATVRGQPLISRTVAGMAFLFAVPAFGLWIVGTVVYKFRVGGARLHAQAMMEAQKRATAPWCGVCRKRAAVTLCTAHRVLLCGPCLGSHNRPECAYADVNVVVQSSGVTPAERVMTTAGPQRKEGVG